MSKLLNCSKDINKNHTCFIWYAESVIVVVLSVIVVLFREFSFR